MRYLILTAALALGCSSRVSKPGYELPEEGAAGAGGLPQIDADVADRILDAYEAAADAASTSGDAALPTDGVCPVLLAFPCEPESCSGTCACNESTHWECVAASSGAYCGCS
jgi:hypothetical protein